jgi:hypothetical protein
MGIDVVCLVDCDGGLHLLGEHAELLAEDRLRSIRASQLMLRGFADFLE